VGVNEFDIMLFAVDRGWKDCGWSFDTEYCFRQIDPLRGSDFADPQISIPVSPGSHVI
jgi:hypothetical protein